jgi:hypothetical protein
LVRAIQRNQGIAYARLRKLAFEKLVYVSSAGPGGGAPTDSYGEQVLQEEIDAAIDDLQELLDKQQQQLGSLGGDGSTSGHGVEATDKPCQEDLLLYEAALKANNPSDAARYLTAYSNCLQVHAGGTSPKKPA